MANLGLQNNNPGNLRDPGTGAFRVFNTPEEGQNSLIQDIIIKQSGKSKHIKPGASIQDLANVWAPASDHNVPSDWAHNVAKFLGVPTAYAFDQIPPEKLAEGIKVAEGTHSMSNSTQNTKQLSHEQLQANIKAMSDQGAPPEAIQNYLDGLKSQGGSQGNSGGQNTSQDLTKDEIVTTPEASAVSNDRAQLIQEGEPVSVNPEKTDPSLMGSLIRGIAKPFAKAATSVVNIEQLARGKQPTQPFSGGYLGHVGPVGEGFDFSQGFTKKNTGALSDAVGTGVSIGATIGGVRAAKGLLGRLMEGSTALKNPEIVKILEGSLGRGETVEALSRQEALTTLANNLKEMSISEAGGKQEQLILRAIKELNPTLLEKKSLLASLAKRGFDAVKLYALSKLLGDKIGGIVHQNTK